MWRGAPQAMATMIDVVARVATSGRTSLLTVRCRAPKHISHATQIRSGRGGIPKKPETPYKIWGFLSFR
jgi:hypothetical protein